MRIINDTIFSRCSISEFVARHITISASDADIMMKTTRLILLPRLYDSNTRELSDICLNKINMKSMMPEKDVISYTLDGIACSGDTLMDADAQMAYSVCNIVDCVDTSIEWACRSNINAVLTPAINLPFVEGYLGTVTSYLTPVKMLACKAGKTQ